MEFSRPEYWSGYSFPSPGDLTNPEIEHRSPTSQVDSLPAEPQGKPRMLVLVAGIPSPVDFPDSGIKLGCLALQTVSLPTELSGMPTLHIS